MKPKKTFVSLILVIALLCTVIVPANAADVPTLTITANTTQIDKGAGTVNVVYTITLNPNGTPIYAFQFKLEAPEGMELSSTKLKSPEVNKGGEGYWVASKSLKYNEDDETGFFTTFEYTPATGYFGASGGTSARNLTESATVMTILATIDISNAKTYTLGVTGFVTKGAEGRDLGTTTPIVTEVKVIDSTPHTHVFDQRTADGTYLKESANCKSPAIYFLSCTCGARGTETFTYGEKNAANHVGGTERVNAKPADHKNQIDGKEADTKCRGCGEIIATGAVIPAGAHQAADTWTTDGNQHWKVCKISGCGVVVGETGRHSATGANVATCQHKAKCDVCSTEYGNLATHDFSGTTYQYSDTQHWKKCANCNATTEKQGHTGSTATCTEKATCTACGQKYGALAPNNHTGTLGDWQKNADKHWKEYSCCQAHQEEAAHVYTNAQDTTCNTCGYERTVTPPPVDKVLESIAVTTNPTKMVYTVGENFDSAGMVVTAYYSDQTSAVVTDYSVSGGSPFAAGDASVTISYTENGVTKNVVLQLTVNQQGGEPEVGVTVTFDANGGKFSDGSTKKEITGETAVAISACSENPTRENYRFDGWYTSANGGTLLTPNDIYYQDTTVYAHWTYIGGDGSITIITHPDNDTTGTKENPGTGAAPSGIGYVFVGLAAVGALCFGAKKLIKKEEE